MKYSLSMREKLRAEHKGFPEGSGYISLYFRTLVIIKTFSISKSYNSSIIRLGRSILEDLMFRIDLAAAAIFSCIVQ